MRSLKKVIVIDDQKSINMIAGTYLAQLGFHVQTFENPLDALNYIAEEKVDLVITDLSMPNMNGFEVIRKIKYSFKKLEIIAMSSVCNSSEDILKAIKLGAKDFILKPFDYDVFSRKVSFLSKKQEKWLEWVLDKNKFSNSGILQSQVELFSIGEVTLTIKSNNPLPIGLLTAINFKVLADVGISNIIVEVIDCIVDENKFRCNLKIIGLKEAEAIKIRQLCRSLDFYQRRK